MNTAAWLILRIVYAWMFLYPLIALLSNWPATVDTVKLIIPWKANFFAVIMVIVMIVGALSILLGIYARVAGFLLLFYNLMGVLVHYRLAKKLTGLQLNASADQQDKTVLSDAIALGSVGHITSAQKNYVLAAVAAFFLLMGSGPLSIVGF